MSTFNPKPADFSKVSDEERKGFLNKMTEVYDVAVSFKISLNNMAGAYTESVYLKRAQQNPGWAWRGVCEEMSKDPLVFIMYTNFSYDYNGEKDKHLKKTLQDGVRLGVWTLHNKSGSNKGKAAIGSQVYIRINPQALRYLLSSFIPGSYKDALTKALGNPYDDPNGEWGWYYYYNNNNGSNNVAMLCLWGLLLNDVEVKALPEGRALYRIKNSETGADAFLAQKILKYLPHSYSAFPPELVPNLPEWVLKANLYDRDTCDQVEDNARRARQEYQQALEKYRDCRRSCKVVKDLGGYAGILQHMGKDIRETLPTQALAWVLHTSEGHLYSSTKDILKEISQAFLAGDLPVSPKEQ